MRLKSPKTLVALHSQRHVVIPFLYHQETTHVPRTYQLFKNAAKPEQGAKPVFNNLHRLNTVQETESLSLRHSADYTWVKRAPMPPLRRFHCAGSDLHSRIANIRMEPGR